MEERGREREGTSFNVMKTWKTRGRVGEDREGGDKGGKKEYNTEGRKKRGRGGEGGRERERRHSPWMSSVVVRSTGGFSISTPPEPSMSALVAVM